MTTQPRRSRLTRACPSLAALITAFHVVKLGGIAVNLALFPVLRAGQDAPGRRPASTRMCNYLAAIYAAKGKARTSITASGYSGLRPV